MKSNDLNIFRLLDVELNEIKRNQDISDKSNEIILNHNVLSLPLSHAIRYLNDQIRLSCPDFYKAGWDIGIENKGFPRLIIRRNKAHSGITGENAKRVVPGSGFSPYDHPNPSTTWHL